jgi:hypothetical protein
VAEEALAEQQKAARAVEADELDLGAVAEAVEQPRPDRRAAGGLLAEQPLRQVELSMI